MEIEGKGGYLVAVKISSDGPEQGCVITAITVICEVKARGSPVRSLTAGLFLILTP